MLKNLKGNKKKIAAAVIALLLVVAVIAGIVAGVSATTSSTVAVVPVSSLNYGEGMDWQNTTSGVITTDAEQNIYLSDTEVVEEVVVKEGQSVHKDDILMRYDISSTKLNLEKEKIKHELIEMQIGVAKQNIITLENMSAVSDDDEMGLLEDFEEVDAQEILQQAVVYKKKLKANAKPVNDDPEDTYLGSEDYPYVFLCSGDTVVITKEFIAKWQKTAKEKKLKHLYFELQTRDKALNLQKAWRTDVMIMDDGFDVEVDLSTGETFYSKYNDPEKMAGLLRKILKETPEDERAAWLAVMMDKLLVATEKEEELKERGGLLAEMLDELNIEDKEEFAQACALLDVDTLSAMFLSLSQNLTQEKVAQIDPDAVAGMITLLLGNMTAEQISAIDTEVLAAFLNKLTAEQLASLDTEVIGATLAGLSRERLGEVMNKLLDTRQEEIVQIVNAYLEEHKQEEKQAEGTSEEQKESSGEEQKESAGQGQTESSSNAQKAGTTEKETAGVSETETVGASETETVGADETETVGADETQTAGASETETAGADETQEKSKEQVSGAGGEQAAGSEQNVGSEQSAGSEQNAGSEQAAGSEQSAGKKESAGKSVEQKEDSDANREETVSKERKESGNVGLQKSTGENSGNSEGKAVPSTASSPSDDSAGSSGDNQLISADTYYTRSELETARREARERLRDLQLDLKESDLNIEKAERALEQGVVKANMNGVIKTVGNPASPPGDGSPFLTLTGSEGLFVKSGIKESKLGTIKEGDIVEVVSWQSGGKFEAEVKSISPYPDTSDMFESEKTETYYPFTANIIDTSAEMKNGEWVEVSYTSSQQSGEDGTMTIVKAFVREEGNKKYVYMRGEDNKLKKQYIITGTLSDYGYEVLDGISESDWVAFPYGKSVKEGAKTREGTVDELYD